MHKKFLIVAGAAMLCACGAATQPNEPSTKTTPSENADVAMEEPAGASASLDEILASMPEEAKARFPHRNPKETLEFFGVTLGMTVVDTTPGDIWYTSILAPYLGPDGTLIGADRPISVWEWFGPDYAPPAFLAERKNWTKTWPDRQAANFGTNAAEFSAVAFGRVPEDMFGSADVVLMFRELHNIVAADPDGALVAQVLAEIHGLLKPGGVFGVVQHRAPSAASDAWASGENGYLKQATVISLIEAAGFFLEESSELNANMADRPTEADDVWRLPPTLDGAEDDEALKSAMIAIGESDRMTLRFVKQ